MIRFIEINGEITIRRVSNKLTAAQQTDNWLAKRQEIEHLRAIKITKKDRRELARATNKHNRRSNARRRTWE